MISWIQRTFQQHFRAVFGVLLAVIIISFIMTINASSGLGSGDRRVVVQDFYGHNLASNADVQQMISDGKQSLYLKEPSARYYNVKREEIQKYALGRIVALALANAWHLPEIGTDSPELVEYIRNTPAFFGSNHQFDPQTYAEIRSEYRSAGPEGEETLARILMEDCRIQRVHTLIGGPGFIPPSDAKRDYAAAETTWSVSVANLDFASFPAPTTVADEQLRKYFTANAAHYEIPARVSVGYVDFPASQYLSEIHVSDTDVRAFYDRDPARFPAPKPKAAAGSKTTPKSDPNADFAAVRADVEKALKLDQARTQAANEASNFSYALYQAKAPLGAGLDQFLAAHHVVEKSLPPFSAAAVPVELGGSPDVAQQAFALSADRYFSEATPTPNGAVVMLWKGSEEPREPLLAEVRAQVTTDFLNDQKERAFKAAAAQLKTAIQARLKGGVPFAIAAIAAGVDQKVKVTVKNLPPFTVADGRTGLPQSALADLDLLSPGQVSDLQFDGPNGVLIYDSGKALPNPAAGAARFAMLRGRQAMAFSSGTAEEFLDEMVELKTKGMPINAE